jgi:hypothetical protein
MTPAAESAHTAQEGIGAPARLPLLAELAGYRERLGPILASTVSAHHVVYPRWRGGYDIVVRSEVGIAICGSCCWAPWWGVPGPPLGRAEQLGLALLPSRLDRPRFLMV